MLQRNSVSGTRLEYNELQRHYFYWSTRCSVGFWCWRNGFFLFCRCFCATFTCKGQFYLHRTCTHSFKFIKFDEIAHLPQLNNRNNGMPYFLASLFHFLSSPVGLFTVFMHTALFCAFIQTHTLYGFSYVRLGVSHSMQVSIVFFGTVFGS